LYTRMVVHGGGDPSDPETARWIQKMVDEKLAEDAAEA